MVDWWRRNTDTSPTFRDGSIAADGKKHAMSLVGQIIGWAFWIGMLLLLPLAVASLWLWGGSKRGALGHLMAGALLLVSGAVFYYVCVINVFARMDNAYLYDDIFGLYFMFLGVTLLAGALVGYGVPPWLAALLWVPSAVVSGGGVAVLWIAFALFAPTHVDWLAHAFPDERVLLYAAILLGGVLLCLMARGYFLEALIAVTLTTVGFALIWRIAGLTMRDFTPVTIVADEYFYKPPYLDLGPLFACLVAATVLYFAGRLIQSRLRGQQPPVDAQLSAT
jgi:hypothetical protein